MPWKWPKIVFIHLATSIFMFSTIKLGGMEKKSDSPFFKSKFVFFCRKISRYHGNGPFVTVLMTKHIWKFHLYWITSLILIDLVIYTMFFYHLQGNVCYFWENNRLPWQRPKTAFRNLATSRFVFSTLKIGDIAQKIKLYRKF